MGTVSSKPDATGRSSGKQSGLISRVMKPPTDEPWIWLSRELLISPAWRGLSVNARKLLDRLHIEHMNHAGTENGRLIVTHDQFINYGLTASKVKPAIVECEFMGLLRFVRGGRWAGSNQPSTYRLTYLPTAHNFTRSTDEWRNVSDDEIAGWKSEQKQRQKLKTERCKKQIPTVTSRGTVPPLRVVPNTKTGSV
ncbi:MAG: hypothetical protein HQ483_08070 [Rhodospirillales bacterium]|nr:hypothetical protein [Rhodospirillales bacterium]